MTKTKTEIANLALSHAREKEINGNVETTDELIAETVLMHYEQTLRLTLARTRPAFAQKRITLTENAEQPKFGWERSFHLPTDFVEMIRFNGEGYDATRSDRYEIEGRQLMTNEGDAYIVYIRYEEDTSLYSSEFIESFALLLGSKVVNARRGDKELAKELKASGMSMASEASAKSEQSRNRYNSRDIIQRSSRWSGVKRRQSTNESMTGDGAVTYDN
jgi:hypothetical protein